MRAASGYISPHRLNQYEMTIYYKRCALHRRVRNATLFFGPNACGLEKSCCCPPRSYGPGAVLFWRTLRPSPPGIVVEGEKVAGIVCM